jgi:putative tricarboxylic transport membrane protein
MPIAVGGGALLVFVGLVVERVRRRRGTDAVEPMNRRAVAIVGAGLLVYMALLPAAGFVIASTLLFWVTAIALGGRARARDLLVGAAFSVAVYVVFTAGLGLSLPAGLFALQWTP